ncbi:MAG: hypothetical protein FWD09_00960 [Lentimicrobiaceae bacterium]|nr:hypothetical protein [Lentimicrobiaceae bacterium]
MQVSKRKEYFFIIWACRLPSARSAAALPPSPNARRRAFRYTPRFTCFVGQNDPAPTFCPSWQPVRCGVPLQSLTQGDLNGRPDISV